ncbi:MAG: CpaF family protein, partial [Maritimibacter sp.]
MFSRYKKPGGAKQQADAPKLHAVDGGKVPPAPKDEAEAAPKAKVHRREAPAKAPAQPAPANRERKRKERLSEIKVELHKQLLDNLNLAALETASEKDLRAE